MKACVLIEKNKLKYTEKPMPKLKETEVLVKIKAVGICNSDFNRVYGDEAYHYPIILGHEIAGEIVKVGKNVTEEYLAKKVVVFPLLPCKKCANCIKGDYAQCINYNYFGSRCDGGFAEYLAVPIWNIKIFDDDIPFSSAALSEPAAVAWHALSKVVNSGHNNILIIGNGTIGIFIGLWAQLFNLKITYISRNKDKTDFLKSLGFKNIIKNTSTEKFDVCFEVVGSNESLITALNYVKTKGKIILVGNPKTDISIEKQIYWKILRQEILIEGVWNSKYPDDWNWVINHLKIIPHEKIITHRFKLEQAIEAFETLKYSSGFKLKGMYVTE